MTIVQHKNLIPSLCAHPLNVILLGTLCFLLSTEPLLATDISSVNVKTTNGDISVTASVIPDTKFIEGVSEGLSKEITIYVDLFRIWKVWPDEFVLGKKVLKIMKSDPIKREYVGVSIEGEVQHEKRFKDLESMVKWSMNVNEAKLATFNALDPGDYYVKITAEARLRKLPPVIGYLLFFLPEKEFSLSKASYPFQIPARADR